MRETAKEIFLKVGLPIEGHEDVFERVVEILGETMAELSVAHATKAITFKKRIALFNSQVESIVEELRNYKAQQCPA